MCSSPVGARRRWAGLASGRLGWDTSRPLSLPPGPPPRRLGAARVELLFGACLLRRRLRSGLGRRASAMASAPRRSGARGLGRVSPPARHRRFQIYAAYAVPSYTAAAAALRGCAAARPGGRGGSGRGGRNGRGRWPSHARTPHARTPRPGQRAPELTYRQARQ